MPGTPLISVVDDDGAVRISLEDLIRSVGLRAQGFPSAEAFLGSNQLQETDCLILDMHLPGISGLELQHQLAATNSHLPIIFITAHEKLGEGKPSMRVPWRFWLSLSMRKLCSMQSMLP
jgi:FixJ family two-component response regulator